MGNFFLYILLSILISAALGYPAMRLAQRFNLVDIPGSAPHKQHARPTPLAGGILVLMTLTLTSLILRQWLTREILVVLCGSLVILLFGFWDDARGLSALPKLAGQFLAASILIAAGIQVNFFGSLVLLQGAPQNIIQTLNLGVTVLWFVGITNAMNLVDSMDGLAAGLSIVTSAFFLGATILSDQPTLITLSAVLLGLCIGLYFWNAKMGYFFLGDSGTQTLGFLLAAIGILYTPLDFKQESSWFVPIILLGVPIFDTSLVVLSRIKKRQPIREGRRDHTYHRLIVLGFTPNRAVLAIHFTALIVSCLAFLALSLPPLWANITFALTVLCGLGTLLWLERKPTLDDAEKGSE